jgi:hypothetical protein
VRLRDLITKVLINPIIRTRTPRFRRACHPTYDNLVSEVGGSDHVGFFSSGYNRKYVTTDVTLHRVVISLHCGDATDDGNPAGKA